VEHQTGRDGARRGLIYSRVPDTPSEEALLRVDEGGRHIFSVKADNLAWHIEFQLLRS
jgi:hypothetical protein